MLVESNRVKLLELVHERIIHPARVLNLTRGLGDLIPHGASLLDVGCGDGSMAALLRDQCGLSRVEGVDVLVRDKVDIPVTSFDGCQPALGRPLLGFRNGRRCASPCGR